MKDSLCFFLFFFSTVGFLVPCSCARATKLLGLAAPVVRYEQRAVMLYQRLLQRVLRVLVNVLLVVGDNRLGNRLPHRVHLRCVAAAGDPDADVNVREFVEADDE
jgi:hypothetical protein